MLLTMVITAVGSTATLKLTALVESTTIAVTAALREWPLES